MHRPPLPIAATPNWELKGNDVESLKSIPESCVTLQSLRQTRDFWVSAFPKFSSRARGTKSQEVTPPPHTIQTRGKCDLHIGPVIFPDTLFYEVHYLPPKPPQSQLPTLSLSAGYTTAKPAQAAPQPVASSSSTQTPPAAAQMSPLSSITPALINQVNTAASTNPTLANLLQLAATGRATPDQLKTLGLLIQSLATVGSMNPSLEPGSLQQPVRPFDLVLEFPECPYDRFLFPRCQVVCERMSNNTLSTYQDILIAAPIPFSTETDASAPSTTAATPATNTTTTTTTTTATATAATPPPVPPCLQVATMRIKSAPVTLWETLSKWMGDEETVSRNRQYLSRLQPSRVYLAHRIREGSLLTELQTLSAPNFTMKSIDPTAPGGVKPKRKYTKREPKPKPAAVPKIAPPAFLVLTPQPPQPPPATQAGPSVISATSQPPAVVPVPPLTMPSVLASSSSTTPYPTPPIATSSTPSASTSTPTPGPPPSKKQRVKPPKQPLPRIACFSCDMTDVPLIMGGRFCRPCVESGKANPDIPQPLRSTGSHRSYYQPVTPSSTAQSTQSSQGTTK